MIFPSLSLSLTLPPSVSLPLHPSPSSASMWMCTALRAMTWQRSRTTSRPCWRRWERRQRCTQTRRNTPSWPYLALCCSTILCTTVLCAVLSFLSSPALPNPLSSPPSPSTSYSQALFFYEKSLGIVKRLHGEFNPQVMQRKKRQSAHCTVLYCTLCSTALYCNVLYSTLQYLLYYTTLHYYVLSYSLLYGTVLHCVILHPHYLDRAVTCHQALCTPLISSPLLSFTL